MCLFFSAFSLKPPFKFFFFKFKTIIKSMKKLDIEIRNKAKKINENTMVKFSSRTQKTKTMKKDRKNWQWCWSEM